MEEKQFALSFQYNALKDDIVKCMKIIVNWNDALFMKINPDKTELMLCRPPSLNSEVIINGMIYDDQCIRFSDSEKNVGVNLDCNLTLDNHVNKVTSHSYKILRDVSQIKKFLSKERLQTLVHAIVTSRLDYCNSLFTGLTKNNIRKLQKVQNRAASLICGVRKGDSVKNTLQTLHWLRVEERIAFKTLLLVQKVLRNKCSSNLALKYRCFNGRPDDSLTLQVPDFSTKYGRRTFQYVGSKLWNALPLHIRCEEDTERFKSQLKTLLFDNYTDLLSKAYRYC
jgi:hypothetical protein